jgi:hypothetical protein
MSLRVLVSREGRQVCAHALEVDLLGYGADEAEAMADLRDAIDTQVSYAATHGKREMVPFAAPAEDFAQWEDLHRKQLPGLPRTRKSRFRAVVMVWEEDAAMAGREEQFAPACA